MAPRIRPHRNVLAARGALSLCAGLAAIAATAIVVAPANSLSLPLETPTVPVKTPTVTTPPVTIKTPTVTVETPTVTVKAPPVTVKVPPVTVKAPPIPAPPPVEALSPPAKAPSVPAKAPSVPAKAPSAPSGSVKAPSVTVRTPDVTASAPGVSVKAPVASGSGAPTVTAKAPGVSVGVGTSSTRSGEAQPAASDGASDAREASDGAGAQLGGYGSLGAGYGQAPPIEGAHGAKARARIASRERNLKATVARERACLSSLPDEQEQLLVLRAGLGQPEPLSPTATAARLRVGLARFAQLEAQALRELGEASTHGCAQGASATAKVMTFLAAGFGGPQARGAVEAVRYEAGPDVAPPLQTSGASLLGIKLSSGAGHAVLAVLALLLAALTTSLIVADAAGAGPRHARWRRHVRERIRAWR